MEIPSTDNRTATPMVIDFDNPALDLLAAGLEDTEFASPMVGDGGAVLTAVEGEMLPGWTAIVERIEVLDGNKDGLDDGLGVALAEKAVAAPVSTTAVGMDRALLDVGIEFKGGESAVVSSGTFESGT